jgi:hypothetical protein
MIRAGLLVLVLGFGGHAQAACLAFCGDGDIPVGKAAAQVEAELGTALPAGVEVLGLFEGGFQDRFIQVKFRAEAAAVPGLLVLLGTDAAEFGPVGTAQMTIAPVDWWTPESAAGLTTAPGRLAGFAETTVAMAADPEAEGKVILYLIAFQT